MRKGNSLSVRLASMIFLVTLLFWGCEKKADPIAGPDMPPTTTGGSISDEARKVALDTLDAFFDRLPGVDPAADRQTVLNFLKTRPECPPTAVMFGRVSWTAG